MRCKPTDLAVFDPFVPMINLLHVICVRKFQGLL